MPIRRAKKDPITEAPELNTVREAQAAYAQAEPLIRQFVALGQLLAFAQKAVDQTEEAKKQHAVLGPEIDRMKETSVDLRDELDRLREQRQALVEGIADLQSQLDQRKRNLKADLDRLDSEHLADVADMISKKNDRMAEMTQELNDMRLQIEDEKAELQTLRDERRRLVERFA